LGKVREPPADPSAQDSESGWQYWRLLQGLKARSKMSSYVGAEAPTS